MALIIGKGRIYENGMVKNVAVPKSEEQKETQAPEMKDEAPKEEAKAPQKPQEAPQEPQKPEVDNSKAEAEKVAQKPENEAKQSKTIIDGSQIKAPAKKSAPKKKTTRK